MTTVWVFQGEQIKVFATPEAAQRWFDEHEPKGVIFRREIEGETEAEVEPGPLNTVAPGC